MKVNRSSSKCAYKKRRTVRKSRVNRRRKTQRGGISFAEIRAAAAAAAKEKLVEAAPSLSIMGKGIINGAGGLTAIPTLLLKLKEIGSATTYPKVLFDILVNFSRDPKKALELLNSIRTDLLKLLDAKDDVKNCLSTLEARIKERIAQSASVAAAAAAKVMVTPPSPTTFLDVIIAKKDEFSKSQDKGEMIKGVIQTKINEVNAAIDGYLNDPVNKDIIGCIKLLKDRMTAKIQANAEDLKTKFTEIRSKYSDQEAKLMGVIETAKAFMDTLKKSAVAAGCPVCPVCKS